MEQEKSNLDSFFRDKLHDYAATPAAGSWRAITDALDQKQKAQKTKTRQLISYSIAASVTMVLIGTFLMFQFNKPVKTIAVKNEAHPAMVTGEKNITTQPKTNKIEQKNELANLEITQKTKSLKKEVTLPDGSKIYLNRNSEITYEENFTQNRVLHLKGEAYFEVQHQHGNPFVVYGQESKTEVAGTTFMIRTLGNGLWDEIYVTSGKVKFSPIHNASQVDLLTAGTKAVLSENNKPVKQEIREPNFAAWKNEKIVFNNTRVDEVISTLEKYFAVPIEVSTPEIYNCRFTGTFEKSDINEVLQVLSITFNLSYNQQEGKYLLSGKGCK